MIARFRTYLSSRIRRNSSSHIYLVFLITLSLALVTSRPSIAAGNEDCTTSTGKWLEERSKTCLQDPGWFDIGAGIVVIPNAGISQQNGVGNLVTLRGYPLGRWYAPLKSTTPANSDLVSSKIQSANTAKEKASKSKQAAVSKLAAAAKAVADANATDLLASAGQTAGKAAADNASTVDDLVKDAAALVKAATDANVATNLVNIVTDAKVAADQAAADQNAADTANTDVAQGMQTALTDFGNTFAIAEFNGMTNWLKRVSIFAGRSVGGFDSNAVDGDINAFGIAFDIAPQFSIVWGRAYFNVPAQTGVANNSKSGTVFGVELNLNAFKAMRGLTGSL